MYQMQTARGATAAVSTQSLLGQVLGITGVGFLITAATAYLTIQLAAPSSVGLIASLVGFGFLFAITATRANEPLSLLLFYLFAAVEGVGIGPLLSGYIANFGPGVVVDAATTTGLGMLVLAAIVGLSAFDFRRLSGVAGIALLVLLIVGIVSIFVKFLHPGVYSWLVLVDFARIKAGGQGQSAVLLATSIYLDGINIFIALLQIFGGRRRND
jgi:modulator of FtsH protease